jgi:hypothetical protein
MLVHTDSRPVTARSTTLELGTRIAGLLCRGRERDIPGSQNMADNSRATKGGQTTRYRHAAALPVDVQPINLHPPEFPTGWRRRGTGLLSKRRASPKTAKQCNRGATAVLVGLDGPSARPAASVVDGRKGHGHPDQHRHPAAHERTRQRRRTLVTRSSSVLAKPRSLTRMRAGRKRKSSGLITAKAAYSWKHPRLEWRRWP